MLRVFRVIHYSIQLSYVMLVIILCQLVDHDIFVWYHKLHRKLVRIPFVIPQFLDRKFNPIVLSFIVVDCWTNNNAGVERETDRKLKAARANKSEEYQELFEEYY